MPKSVILKSNWEKVSLHAKMACHVTLQTHAVDAKRNNKHTIGHYMCTVQPKLFSRIYVCTKCVPSISAREDPLDENHEATQIFIKI